MVEINSIGAVSAKVVGVGVVADAAIVLGMVVSASLNKAHLKKYKLFLHIGLKSTTFILF